jgi:hypothetical protein
VDGTLRPPPAIINAIGWSSASNLVLGFQAHSNLDYALQYRSKVDAGVWSLLKDFGTSSADRSLFYTNPISNSQSGFFQLSVKP